MQCFSKFEFSILLLDCEYYLSTSYENDDDARFGWMDMMSTAFVADSSSQSSKLAVSMKHESDDQDNDSSSCIAM